MTLTEHIANELIFTVQFATSANDEAFRAIVAAALHHWKAGKAEQLRERIRTTTNWQHARLSQLEPGLN